MSSSPITPYYGVQWGAKQLFIQTTLGLSNAPSVEEMFNDNLGNILGHISCSGFAIQINHPHVEMAINILKCYPFPSSMEEYCKTFRFKEWEYVCKAVLAAYRLKLLVPNQFQ